jgi:hypothetical protein
VESPYLFYSKHPPFRAETDVLAIDFEYSRNEVFLGLDDAAKDEWFRGEVGAVASFLVHRPEYRHLHWIGKSLGTSAVYALLQNAAIRGRTRSGVWLTPGEARDGIADLLITDDTPALVV